MQTASTQLETGVHLSGLACAFLFWEATRERQLPNVILPPATLKEASEAQRSLITALKPITAL
jgi:hypothetical protein